MGFVSEFKEFINKGNVMDLAVAVIIGSAFQKIVDSLVNDIIMPIIAMLGNMDNIEKLVAGPFTYGKLMAAVINFILIALVLFIMVKAMNRAKSTVVKE
ncbi:MAG: large conductance mechanosensitive channel protein MscL [Bacteroidetes bacterium]|nr:large conductance mechanosensitive channel protein MscL [Bacteroidota bacterium]